MRYRPLGVEPPHGFSVWPPPRTNDRGSGAGQRGDVREEGRGEIPLAEAREDGHDDLPGAFRALGHDGGGAGLLLRKQRREGLVRLDGGAIRRIGIRV
jgi:hypothetical protein